MIASASLISIAQWDVPRSESMRKPGTRHVLDRDQIRGTITLKFEAKCTKKVKFNNLFSDGRKSICSKWRPRNCSSDIVGTRFDSVGSGSDSLRGDFDSVRGESSGDKSWNAPSRSEEDLVRERGLPGLCFLVLIADQCVEIRSIPSESPAPISANSFLSHPVGTVPFAAVPGAPQDRSSARF
jgi:hypothetical protein